MDVALAEADGLLVTLLHHLKKIDYQFVTPTPLTHARVVARGDRKVSRALQDILGWSLPFLPGSIDEVAEDLLERAGLIEQAGPLLRSLVRVSSLHGHLFLHSAYPTESAQSVFFGPDSYRFADLVRTELQRCPDRHGARIVDVGTGAGVGAIVAALACPGTTVSMTDINPEALRLARINAAAVGVEVSSIESDSLASIDDPIDVVVANPPYIVDAKRRAYRDGGEMHGAALSLQMAEEAIARIAPGGRLILYTGSAIVRGHDQLRAALLSLARKTNSRIHYRELDPDVFGEELDNEAYADVDRIALVAAVLVKPT